MEPKVGDIIYRKEVPQLKEKILEISGSTIWVECIEYPAEHFIGKRYKLDRIYSYTVIQSEVYEFNQNLKDLLNE